MAPQALTLLTLLIAHGLVDVTASPPQDLSLMQKSAIVHSESPIVAADEGTAAPAQEVDDDHEHDHEEDVEEEDHDDHEGEHDEHHDDHVAAMKALKVVLVEIDAAIEDIAKEGKEAAVLGHLDHAAKSIAVALGKEKGHGPDESHENSHEHEHSAEKLKHAQEHLEHAIADLKEHKEGESEAEHAEHTGHATKDLKTVKETVMHALSDGLRACATGEVEHALRDLLKAMIAASGPKPEDAAALIQHAIGDLEHATEDLKGLTDEEHKFEQDSHALEDIQHAVSDLKHALEDLAGHEGHEGADADTEHMMKDLKHAMRDLKCANDDLHTAHSLSDLHCALKDLGHIAEHKDDATEMAHVAECIAEDVVHAAVSAVKSKHLYKSYGARLVKAAARLKKKPSSARGAAYAKKYIDKSIAVIQKKCEAHHEKVEKTKCYQECEEAHDSCANTAECKALADYAKAEKACRAVAKLCKPKCKACKKACKELKHGKHDEHEKEGHHDEHAKPAIEKRF